MIGQTINHYHITAKLGAGGMGEVYLADDTKLGRKVALKFLPENLTHDSESRERLLREAKSASKINHPNILTVYSVEQSEDRDFIVMEYVDGLTLEDFIQQQTSRLDEILGIAVGIALGLSKAHQAGIVHRDLKPSNILIDSDHRARIFDFGLAKLPGASKLTQTGSTVGTFAYMSPEQGRGDEADYRSDIFSFGVILYEMIAGQTPFTGDHQAAILYSTANEEPEPLARYKVDVPDEVQRIVSKCLAKRPQDRYQSAADLTTDLKQVRRSLISGSRVSTLSNPPPKPKRSGLILSATAVAVIALILFVLKPWKFAIEPNQDAGAVENRLAVMYFDNIADPSDPDRLGEIATTLLITDLSESQYVQVISTQRLLDILGSLGHGEERQVDHATATAVAREAKAHWMLMGSILKAQPNLIVAAQLIDVATGNTVASQRINGKEGEDIFSLVDQLTVQVKNDLALPAAAQSEADPAIAEGTTHSTEAYREYLKGLEYLGKYYWSDGERCLRKAIEIDSTFAMAYYWLTNNSLGTKAEQRDWSARAQRFSGNLPRKSRWYIEAEAANINGDLRGEREAYERIAANYPDERDVFLQLGMIYRNEGRYADAIAVLDSAVALDPRCKLAYNLMAYTYNSMGNFDASITAINKYITLAPDEANPLDSRGDLYAYNGKFDEAAASYRAALAAKPSFYMSLMKLGLMAIVKQEYERADSCFTVLAAVDVPRFRSGGRMLLALLPAYRGRFTDALRIVDDGLAADRMEQAHFEEVALKFGLKGQLLAYRGEYEPALENMIRADSVAKGVVTNLLDSYGWGIVWIEEMRGNHSAADSALQAYRAELQAKDSSRLAAYWEAKARVENMRGNYQAALTALANISPQQQSFWVYRQLAIAHLGLDEPADAVTYLEKIVGHWDDPVMQDPILMVGSIYLLGTAYEASGWSKRAVEQYETFLSFWGEGDPGLPYVDDAKARLARLRQQS